MQIEAQQNEIPNRLAITYFYITLSLSSLVYTDTLWSDFCIRGFLKHLHKAEGTERLN